MRSSRLLTALLLASSMIAAPAMARHHHSHHVAVNKANSVNSTNAYASNTNGANAMSTNTANTNVANTNAANAGNSNELAVADGLMQNSQGIISQMQSDSNVANLMRSAKAVFIIPNSGNACTNAGAGCGGGVMLISNNGRWSDPVFFSVSSGTTTQPGANNTRMNNATVNNTGANNGPVALLVMSNRALNQFRSGGNISLNGKRRLTVINYQASANTQPASLQRSDLIVWSGSNGDNALPSLKIRANTAFDQTIYGTNNQHRIVAGRAPLTNQLAVNLANQMPQGQAPTQLGSNQPGTMRNRTQPG